MTWCECSHEGQFDILLVFSISVHANQRPDFMWLHLSATETFRLGRENIPVIALVLLLRKLAGFTWTWMELKDAYFASLLVNGHIQETLFKWPLVEVSAPLTQLDSIGSCRRPFSNFCTFLLSNNTQKAQIQMNIAFRTDVLSGKTSLFPVYINKALPWFDNISCLPDRHFDLSGKRDGCHVWHEQTSWAAG